MDVFFNQNFWYRGKSGEETGTFRKLQAKFQYAGFEWRVPGAYCFEQGFTLDLCRRIPREALQHFFEEWKAYADQEDKLTPSQARKIERENPQNFWVSPEVTLGDSRVCSLNGCSLCWQPCLPEFNKPEAEEPVTEYALDRTDGWEIYRFNFRWPENCLHTLEKPCLRLCAQPVSLPCNVHFSTKVDGAPFSIPFRHPRTGEPYSIEITGCEAQQISPPQNLNEKYRWPKYACVLEYRVNPALPDGEQMSLRDCAENDSPVCTDGAKLDGPSALIYSSPKSDTVMTSSAWGAISALHFAPVALVEWEAELQAAPVAPSSFPL